jgi:hypothetical protein
MSDLATEFNRRGYTDTVDQATGVTTRSWKPLLRQVVRIDRDGFVLSVGMQRAVPNIQVPGFGKAPK